KHDFKSRQDFWIPKIERNIARDREVNARLAAEGWTVLRFFGREIMRNLDECVRIVAETVARKKSEVSAR
ncbi:MAG: DUF559 domain-containing protein, partial [Selenomonadaceae bacterium]|nr:DUF559 domain-containing protein [Selenomonadaceae bacterium]